MRLPSILFRLILIKMALLSGVLASAEGAEMKAPEWYEVENAVDRDVRSEGLSKLLRTKYDGAEAARVMREFDLRVRAGDAKEAQRAIKKLATAKPALSAHTLSEMADFLIDRKETWLARQFLETFPQASPGWGYVFLLDWNGGDHSAEKTSKNQTLIEAWLGSRIATGINTSYWVKEKIRFLDSVGSSEPYVDQLASDVRKKAGDAESVLNFLEVIDTANHQPSIFWLFDSSAAMSAYDTYRIGDRLQVRYPSLAARYFNRSLTTPYSAADQKNISEYMRTHSAMFHQADFSWEESLRNWSKHKLAECYQKTGEPAKAQKLLVELSKSQSGPMPTFALTQMAGALQSQLQQRPLENMIKKAEPENKDSAEYWLGRAQYYSGRQEAAQAIDAFEKALKLTSITDTSPPSEVFLRRRAVNDYAYYFKRNNQADRALVLLWKEVAATRNLDLQSHLFDTIKEIDSLAIRSDDKRLWNFLSLRADWTRSEELLIWKMYENGPLDHETFWRRCEQLVNSGPPSRAAVLGWVMTRCGENARAIPVLQRACSMLKDEDALLNARFALFGAYLDSAKWREAEQLWPLASKHLTPHEVPAWFARIALAAARSGAQQDAFRLWKKKDEMDRAVIAPITELAKLGLKQQLIQYYRQMANDEPSSRIPGEALKLLGV